MAKPRGLLTEYEAPWSAPYGTPVMNEAVRSGMQRLRTAGRRSGLKPNDKYFNPTLLQDVLSGLSQVAGAPMAGLLAPAMPYLQKAADYMPSPEAIGPKGSWTGDGGKRPATMGEKARGLLQTATRGVDAGAEAIQYPKEYAREAAAAGAGLLAGPILRQGARAGRVLEKGLNRVGLTAEAAANQANMFVPVTNRAKPADVGGRQAVDVAEEMKAAGADPRSIWAKTGLDWHPVAKQWRHEISDHDATLTMPYDQLAKLMMAADGHDIDLPALLNHPRLYEAIPELRDYRVRLNPRGTGGVMSPHVFDDKLSAGNLQALGANMADDDPRWMNNPSRSRPSPNRDKKYRGTISINMEASDYRGATPRLRNENEFMKTLLHEVQHAVRQGSKGFPEGSDYRLGHDQYWKNAGETEARLTPNRRYLDEDERRMFYPGADPNPRELGKPQDNYQHDFPYDQQVMGPFVSDGYGPRRGWDQARPEDLASSFAPVVPAPSRNTATMSGAPVGLTPDGRYDVGLGRDELRAMLPGYDPTKGYTTTRKGLVDLQEKFFKYKSDYEASAREAMARGDDAAAAHFRALYFAANDLINSTASRLSSGGYKKSTRKPKGLLDAGDDAPDGVAESDQPYTVGANGGGLIAPMDRNLANERAHPGWISQRLPVGKTSPENALKQDLLIGKREFMMEPKRAEKALGLLSEVPGFEKRGRKETDQQYADRFVRHVADNLLSIYDNIPAATRQRSQRWYPGGRRLIDKWSGDYKVPDIGVAGNIAALSPQKDWFENVSLAQRVMDAYANRGDIKATGGIFDFANERMKPDQAAALMAVKGKSLDQLIREGKLEEASFLLRAHDEVFGDRRHRLVTPEGEFGDFERTKNGGFAGTGWQSYGAIENALASLVNPTREVVNSRMGKAHKVRNFYNNLLDPWSPHGDVTVDTHAGAAGLLTPLSGNDAMTTYILGQGGPGSDLTGVRGLYGLLADGHRVAAHERGVLPRAMQSISWEGIRGMFRPEWKGSLANRAKVAAIWDEVQKGRITREEAFRRIEAAAGGIAPPTWE